MQKKFQRENVYGLIDVILSLIPERLHCVSVHEHSGNIIERICSGRLSLDHSYEVIIVTIFSYAAYI